VPGEGAGRASGGSPGRRPRACKGCVPVFCHGAPDRVAMRRQATFVLDTHYARPYPQGIAEDNGLGRTVEVTDQWLFKSETYDNCNCQINCGCQFNVPSTNGYCQSAYIGHIVEGHFNDTPLVGLNWACLYKWPGEIKDGNGKRQIIIDERADETQRIALQTIISGDAC